MSILNDQTVSVICVIILIGGILLTVFNPLLYLLLMLHGHKREGKENVDAYYASEYYRQTRLSWERVINDRGRRGEYHAYKALHAAFPDARFLFNVYVPTRKGETSEIDIVMITTRGVVVVESKNMQGDIEECYSQPEWIQRIPQKDGAVLVRKFYSPIFQNEGHIRHLREYIGDVPCFSLVVFSGNMKLHQCTRDGVTIVDDAGEDAMAMLNKAGKSIAPYTVDELYNALVRHEHVGDKVTRTHAAQVKARRVALMPRG